MDDFRFACKLSFLIFIMVSLLTIPLALLIDRETVAIAYCGVVVITQFISWGVFIIHAPVVDWLNR